jgi:hypothetical protein
MLAMKTDVLNQLFDAPDPTAAYDFLVAAEKAVLPKQADEK